MPAAAAAAAAATDVISLALLRTSTPKNSFFPLGWFIGQNPKYNTWYYSINSTCSWQKAKGVTKTK